MTDLISRQDAIDALGKAHFQNYGYAILVIYDVPSALKTAEWEENLQELEDRFGAFVRFIVEDMLSGEGKRWKTNVVSGSQQEHLHTTGLNIPVRFGDATIK